MKDIVIVTGSSGRIGKALCIELAKHFTVIGMDIDPHDVDFKHVEWLKTDLTNEESVAQSMTEIKSKYGEEIAGVFHLAAYYDFSGEDSDLYEQLTVQGTRRLLEHLSKFNVGQFAFTSTHLVHAPCEIGEKITEDSPVQGKWQYPQSKIDAEAVIQSTPKDFPVVIYRVTGVYDDYCRSLPLSNQIRRIFEREMTSSVYPGSIEAGQPYVHIDDLVQALYKGLLNRNTLDRHEVFLLGEPDSPSYDSLQRKISKELYGEEWETEEVPKSLAKAGASVKEILPGSDDEFIKPWMIDMADDHYDVDISAAKEKLGWMPQHRVLSTIPSMIDYLKTEPESWYSEHGFSISPALESVSK